MWPILGDDTARYSLLLSKRVNIQVLGQVEPYLRWADQGTFSPPPSSLRYIEEEDPEWRDLDYDLEVGHPPQTFCQFYLQHDCGVFDSSEMTVQVFSLCLLVSETLT